jgi:hypothetical protein
MKSLVFFIRRFWDRHWRAILIILALITVLIWDLAAGQTLLAGRVDELTQGVWSVKLVRGCHLDYHAPIQAVALACPGVDYLKLWPLPPEQPWQETPDPMPEPAPGWYAIKVRATFLSN